jgi:glycolate oxidase iron-sulfur subunit
VGETYGTDETLLWALRCRECGGRTCEAVCPMHRVTRRESLGPRSRLSLIAEFLGDDDGAKGPDTAELLEAAFTYLHCGACTSQCSARIPIPDVVPSLRALLLRRPFR